MFKWYFQDFFSWDDEHLCWVGKIVIQGGSRNIVTRAWYWVTLTSTFQDFIITRIAFFGVRGDRRGGQRQLEILETGFNKTIIILKKPLANTQDQVKKIVYHHFTYVISIKYTLKCNVLY